MKKTAALKVVNVLLLLVFLSQVGSAFTRTVLPYELFHILHGYGGFLLLILVVVHVALNWNWVKNQLWTR